MTSPEPTDNVQAVLDAYSEVDGTYADPNGVVIFSIELCCDASAGNAIMLTTPDHPIEDPVVIVNPPIIIRDDNGDIYKDGYRFREDPLGAIADVIRQYGGPGQ